MTQQMLIVHSPCDFSYLAGKLKQLVEDLSYAFDQAQDNDFNPSWIDEDSCLELNPGKTVNNELFFSYFRDPA